ncbi:MAG: FAD-binding oxidoreductase [Sulfobacillus thermosulfidooxidans]|uniref:FAD-binding oxidoreductase n=1 Tax=Sulfobacillus TaxID=28033 RepID=UPI000CD2E8F2|nr:FAD-binding oxidoreductase [Sulfobacillus sp. hq2]POB10657.1 hypothetical protein CO251_07440 [Sulfobacillus sp. hq2]PSR37701.1 MAG: FAD-binding oxidoreductase [Sulfobacillus thermosulfidooxidans]
MQDVAALLAEIVEPSAVDPSPDAEVYGVHPHNEEQIAEICRLASQHRWRVVPRGRPLERKAQDPTIAIYTDRMVGMSEYSPGDMIVSVRSGTLFESLQNALRTHQQMLALDAVCDARATVGGLVSCAAYGPSRVGYGTLRDLVTGLRVVRADGSVIQVGSKVVKNVAGYDLPKLFIGSHGSLGVITECTFKLHPLPRHRALFAVTGPAAEVGSVYQIIMRNALTVSMLEMVSATQAPNTISSHAPNAWTLLVGSDEPATAAQALQKQIREITKSANVSLEILENDDVTKYWEHYRAALISAETTVRVQMAPTQMVEFADALQHTLLTQEIEASWSFTLSDGVGKIYGYGDTEDHAKTLVRTVVTHCQSSGVSFVIERMPADVMWTEPMMESRRLHAGEWRLMQQIKATYDPYGILNPGVFARGM